MSNLRSLFLAPPLKCLPVRRFCKKMAGSIPPPILFALLSFDKLQPFGPS